MDYNAQYQAYLNTAETALAQQADRCFNERSRVLRRRGTACSAAESVCAPCFAWPCVIC